MGIKKKMFFIFSQIRNYLVLGNGRHIYGWISPFNIILLNVRALEALLKFLKNKILIKGGNRNYITSLERLD